MHGLPIWDAMDDQGRAVYDALPDVVTIWRGCYAHNVYGQSWTLNATIAAKFPFLLRYRHGGAVDRALLIEGRVRKGAIAFLVTDRNEGEVVTSPFAVEIVGQSLAFDALDDDERNRKAAGYLMGIRIIADNGLLWGSPVHQSKGIEGLRCSRATDSRCRCPIRRASPCPNTPTSRCRITDDEVGTVRNMFQRDEVALRAAAFVDWTLLAESVTAGNLGAITLTSAFLCLTCSPR